MTRLFPDNDYRTSPLPFLTPGRTVGFSPTSLVEMVQAAVQDIEESRLHPLISKSGHWMPPPRSFLALLTYCYAKQTYASSEIVRFMSRDAAFCRACLNEIPSAQEIRLFRWYNRWAIEKCLAATLRFLGEQPVASGLVTRIQESFIAEEAKRRIIMAACMDDLESENGNQILFAA